MENKPDRYDEITGIYYDSEGIGYRFEVKNLGRFLFDFARFTFKFNSMFRVWNYDFLLKLFGLIFVRIDDNDKSVIIDKKEVKSDTVDIISNKSFKNVK
jgi:hypothetical protein